MSAACVVDIGEEKTSLCCVEDGMSNANTRYGLIPYWPIHNKLTVYTIS